MPFYSTGDWEQSNPNDTHAVHYDANDGTDILWPLGAPFDTLTDGEHPVLAFGRKANRPRNITGAVISYNAATGIAVMDLREKQVVRTYVANIAGYDGQAAANAWQNTVYPGDPVYVDDTAAVAALNTGCTLSFSSVNGAAADNPQAGYVFWCQDEYADSGIGGPNSTQQIDQPAVAETSEVLTLCVVLTNEFGIADLD